MSDRDVSGLTSSPITLTCLTVCRRLTRGYKGPSRNKRVEREVMTLILALRPWISHHPLRRSESCISWPLLLLLLHHQLDHHLHVLLLLLDRRLERIEVGAHESRLARVVLQGLLARLRASVRGTGRVRLRAPAARETQLRTSLGDVVSCSHVDNHVVQVRELARDVERGRQRDQDRLACDVLRGSNQPDAVRWQMNGRTTTNSRSSGRPPRPRSRRP